MRNMMNFVALIVNEPRGWDAMVGALLVPSEHPDCDHGIIFFNNVGSLWMCGHGTIGLGVTLKYLGQADYGKQKIESPVGVIEYSLLDDHTVELTNVLQFSISENRLRLMLPVTAQPPAT